MVPVSYSLSSSAVPVSEPLEVPQPLFGLTLGQELKAGFHAGVLKEPIVTQRANQNLPSTAATVVSPPVSAGWHSGSVPSMEMKTSDSVSFGPSLPNIGTGASAAQQYYHRNGSRPESFDTNQYYGLSGLHSRSLNASGSTSSSLAVPSSLGLFSGWASSGLSDSSSQDDWNTGSLKPTLDYTSIDWSLDSTPLQTSAKCGGLSNTWSTMFMGGKVTRPPKHDHRNGWYTPQPQEGSVGPSNDPSSLPVGSHEWAKTFEGRDLFHVPRYYVTPPSL
ncbi:hypothetical protein HPP92_026793 [Vanilla planifolia]|uniref:Uncharacterized protein n=1 Tax=Vanilla planifolia TaxID=51239 RepID=A0A835PBN0_VANPL|nr:hypothetical protein HPP92_026793 [Vanilla planifolia]